MKLNRDEMLACIIALERVEKPHAWEKSALTKLLKEMGFKPKDKPNAIGNAEK